MAWNDLNPLKLPPETISIGFLLLLRSFWVVAWPVYDHLELKAKIGPKWPKRAPNDRNWPECLKSDIRNHLHWISASLAVILSGHMTSLQQFWIWGQNWTKMAEKGSKWPKKGLKVWKWHPKPSPSDSCFSCGHFEWSHDYSATILNLRPKLAKMAKNDRKRPKMTKNGLNVCNMTEIDWFDVVTALKGQFWVSVLTSSSSEAGPAKNLNFGTVKIFSWNAATDHISSFSFTQSA